MKQFLIAINVLLYLGLGALWIMFPHYKTLNFSLTIFNLSFSSLLLYQHNEKVNKKAGKQKKNRVTYAIINLMLVTVILAFLNYLSFSNSSQFDLTKNRVNSITEETKKLLMGVEGELKFLIFAQRTGRNSILEILELYRQQKSDVKIEFIDVQERPDLVKANEIRKAPSIKISFKGRNEIVEEITEAAITNAIMRLARGENFKVYYTIGHNELTVEDTSDQGMSALIPVLNKRMYQMEPLSFSHSDKVPEDTSILVVWGPKLAFSLSEIEKIESYLKRGGKLLVALDPEVNEERLTDLRELLARWGINLENTLVIDRASFVDGSNGTVPIAKSYNKSHEIYKKISPPIFFPLTSMVSEGKAEVMGGVFRPILFSSAHPDAWADVTPTEIISGEVLFNHDEDVKGPIPLGGTWEEVPNEKKKVRTRIVAFGNSSFVGNSYMRVANNSKLFMAALNWLSYQDSFLKFNLPVASKGPVFLQDQKMRLVFYASVVIIPVLLLLTGGIFFIRRQKA